VMIVNASLWTGGDSGHEVIHGDILLDHGIIKAVGDIPKQLLSKYRFIDHVNAGHAWVTPGIVDIHSHIGVDSVPETEGALL
jgi:imidazolonepropionase-like amidohydrolase